MHLGVPFFQCSVPTHQLGPTRFELCAKSRSGATSEQVRTEAFAGLVIIANMVHIQ
jgi:hypothetical protein